VTYVATKVKPELIFDYLERTVKVEIKPRGTLDIQRSYMQIIERPFQADNIDTHNQVHTLK